MQSHRKSNSTPTNQQYFSEMKQGNDKNKDYPSTAHPSPGKTEDVDKAKNIIIAWGSIVWWKAAISLKANSYLIDSDL